MYNPAITVAELMTFVTVTVCAWVYLFYRFVCSHNAIRFQNDIIPSHNSRKFNFWHDRGVPGPTPIPIFGNSFSIMSGSITNFDITCRETYGKLYGTYEGTVPILIMADPVVVKQVFNANFSKFTDQFVPNPSSHDPFHMEHIVALQGDKWRRVRQVMNRSMAVAKMREAGNHNFSVSHLMQQLEKRIGQRIDAPQLLVTFTMSAALSMLLGVDLDLFNNPQAGEIMDIVTDVFTTLSILNVSFSQYWLVERLPFWLSKVLGITSHTLSCTNYYRNVITHILRERMKSDSIELRDKPDYLNTVIDAMAKGQMTEDEVIASTMIMSIAAFGPTSSALVFMVYELAKNPVSQRCLQHEIDNLLAGKESVTFDDLPKFKYLDAVIRETIRMHAAEARSFRIVTAAEGVTVPGSGIHLPRGSSVQVPHYGIHYDPDYWPNPHVFDPSRFLPENKSKMQVCSFMGFGSGPRMCPGVLFAETLLKMTAIHVLHKYDLSSPAPDRIVFPRNSVIATTDGVSFVANKRASQSH